MDRDPFDLVGDVLDGQFRVDSFAGEGDLSVVYKGHHIGVDAPVAIKCLNLPETLDAALARPLVAGFNEASRIHYRLARGNLHIAQTIASGSTLVPRTGMSVPYLVREWFEGESLASDLRRRRGEKQSGRPVDEAISLLETAFDAIGYAHEQGDVHLSINPSNLFVVQRKGKTPSPSLKVLDFGVARTMNDFGGGFPGASRSAAGLRLLFPAYAAPEQLDRAVGEPGPWTDVYALALVMMEVLSDRAVMSEAETGAVVERALADERRPTPQSHGLTLPVSIDRALTRAVARLPERRQKNAGELWRDLKATARTSSSVSVLADPAIATLPPIPALRSVQPSLAALRPRAQTLVGMSAPLAMAAGAVGRRSTSTSATVVTMRPAPYEPQPAVTSAPAPPIDGAPTEEPQSLADAVERAFETSSRREPGPSPATRAPLQWASIALHIAGALAWLAVFVAVLLPMTLSLRGSGDAKDAKVPPPTPASSTAPEPAASSAQPAPEPVSAPEPALALATAAPSSTGPFSAVAAKRALDRVWREVGRCRRGKKWGNATATVTFAGDGSVEHVDVGAPFTGTPTGDCAIAALTAAHTAPFVDAQKPDPTAVLVYRFYVAPR
jgi:serine/threonine protein kinase